MICVPWQLVCENAAHKVFGLPGQTLPLPLWIALLVGIAPAAMALHHFVERPAREAMRSRRAWFAGPGRGAALAGVVAGQSAPVA